MDETIGVKGGKNDRRRSIIISNNKKKKIAEAIEDEELKELEKKVKKNQIFTLIKTLPLVVGGGVVKTIYDISKSDTKPVDVIDDDIDELDVKPHDNSNDKGRSSSNSKSDTKKVITLPDGKKAVVYVDINQLREKKNRVDDDTNTLDKPTKLDGNGNRNDNNNISNEGVILEDYSSDFDSLDDRMKDRLERLKSRKIIDEYEKQLKDIRFDLRRVIYEYNVLVDEDEKVILSHEAEAILDKLSLIISKVEELKSKLRIEDLDKYDDNYIYYLIEGYLQEFKDGKLVSEMKDSPLYIAISNKLDELEKKRDDLDKKVSDKKNVLEEREKDFDEIKNKYNSIDKINSDLLKFQYEQDALLREIQDKVRNATSVRERVETQVVGLNRQSRRLGRTLSMLMFLPGPRSAKALTATAAAYVYFYNNIVRPNTVTRKYRVISVKDYEDSIKNSIESLDDALRLLTKTSKKIDEIIKDIQEKFRDYIGVLPECDELLVNLHKVKSELMEKEYEMERIKSEQKKELEKNNAKVKTIGEYPVN